MNLVGFPLRYLKLDDVNGRRLYLRDMLAMLAVTGLMSCPFLLLPVANFFHKDGFVDKIGAFSSVLTGFYVAGLVAVATFPRDKNGLDKVIEVGPIQLRAKDDEEAERLTRREYVCAMFGYLAFMSMAVTITSIICVTTSDWFKNIPGFHLAVAGHHLEISRGFLRGGLIISGDFMLSSLLVTTVRALYYLIDRLYVTAPKPLPRPVDHVDDEA